MWKAWQTITWMTEPLLETLTTPLLLLTHAEYQRTTGSLLTRLIYHYWYHTGEIMAIRQLLGHPDLPEFVGNLDTLAPYLPHV